jgi:hypothetical protein
VCAGGRQRRGSAGSILPIEINPNRPTVGELLMKRPWPRMLPPAQGKGESPGICRGFRLATTTVGQVGDAVPITSVRQAAAICDVSLPVIRRWLSLGLTTEPPWTVEQLRQVRALTDREGRRRGNRAAHGTITRWNAGCSCAECRRFQRDEARARGRRKAQVRLPADVPAAPIARMFGWLPNMEMNRTAASPTNCHMYGGDCRPAALRGLMSSRLAY